MRTTADAVGKLLEVDASVDMSPFIETANALVTERCAAYYDDTRLELIERWLSAHFYAVRDPRATSEGAGGVSASYEGAAGRSLDFTRYGQQTKLLDTKGTLASLDAQSKDGARRVASVKWLGSDATY